MTDETAAPPGKALAPGLYITATPIGNLRDITLRALDVLKAADRLLCEDTRMAGILTRHFGISASPTAYHEHNAARMLPRVLGWLAAGERVVLTSDAGTPLISDPGYRLVRAAQDDGRRVFTIPGASAVIAGLSIAGLPTDHFYFEGFLPQKTKARRDRLAALKGIDATLVFYESPRRLADSLAAMAETVGDREAVVARELTKAFEEVRRAPVAELAAHYGAADTPKGEIVVLLGPPAEQETDWDAIDARLREQLATLRLKEAVDRVSAESGAPRRAVYQRALALKDRT